MASLSQSIVNFIAELSPLYTCQHADGHECALSLLDGTLILPLDESHAADQEGWVAVFWQGDCHRRSEVIGTHLANLAIWRHVELHGIGQPGGAQAVLRQSLVERFRCATDLSLLQKPLAIAS